MEVEKLTHYGCSDLSAQAPTLIDVNAKSVVTRVNFDRYCERQGRSTKTVSPLMPKISNDHELREAIDKLSAPQQRRLGASFAKDVLHLCRDERVVRAVETALDTRASQAELEDAYRAAKAYATKTYTACGKDTDWLAQADHFVAASAVAALTPPNLASGTANAAWKAAVQARMAKNCEMVETDQGDTESTAERQYRIASEAL